MKPEDLWFRFTNGTDSLFGHKEYRDLILTFKTRGILLDVRLERASADKLRDWLNRAFPTSSSTNRSADVIRLTETLPVPDDSGDPEAGT